MWTGSTCGLKDARRRPLEQSFEEPLDRGEGAGHQVAESSRGTFESRSAGMLDGTSVVRSGTIYGPARY